MKGNVTPILKGGEGGEWGGGVLAEWQLALHATVGLQPSKFSLFSGQRRLGNILWEAKV